MTDYSISYNDRRSLKFRVSEKVARLGQAALSRIYQMGERDSIYFLPDLDKWTRVYFSIAWEAATSPRPEIALVCASEADGLFWLECLFGTVSACNVKILGDISEPNRVPTYLKRKWKLEKVSHFVTFSTEGELLKANVIYCIFLVEDTPLSWSEQIK